MGLLVGWFVSHNEQPSLGLTVSRCFVHGIKTWGGKIYAMAIKTFLLLFGFLVLFGSRSLPDC